MTATSAPFGLRPVNADAATATRAVRAYGGSIGENVLPSGYGTAIFKNTPVQLNAAGQIQPVGTTAGTAALILGSFAGVEYTDINNRRRESPFWPAGLTTFGTGTTSTRVYVHSAENGVFEVQSNGVASQALVGAEVNMLQADLAPPAGNTITGLSSARANSLAALPPGTQGQLVVLGFGLEPNNSINDAFVILRVKVALPQMGGAWVEPL